LLVYSDCFGRAKSAIAMRFNRHRALGVEGDLEVTGAFDIFAPWKFSNPWFGTVRGRAGYHQDERSQPSHRAPPTRRPKRRAAVPAKPRLRNSSHFRENQSRV
jgi:hypothetical protein